MKRILIQSEQVKSGTGHSSKGNQMKWQQDHWWYKADAFGYESLAETICSGLLKEILGEEVVRYEPIEIQTGEKIYRGCRSLNFRKEEEEIIPLEKLFRSYTGFGLANMLSRIGDTKEKIRYTVDFVRQVTGLQDFGAYLTLLLEIDAFFLNEDRHTNNLAVLYQSGTGTYRLCPVFDMGLSLLSDTREAYPMEKNIEECRNIIQAKPFHTDFDEQMDAANELYGSYLRFPYGQGKIEKKLDEIWELYEIKFENGGYSDFEKDRCRQLLRVQARKYSYFFQ